MSIRDERWRRANSAMRDKYEQRPVIKLSSKLTSFRTLRPEELRSVLSDGTCLERRRCVRKRRRRRLAAARRDALLTYAGLRRPSRVLICSSAVARRTVVTYNHKGRRGVPTTVPTWDSSESKTVDALDPSIHRLKPRISLEGYLGSNGANFETPSTPRKHLVSTFIMH